MKPHCERFKVTIELA